MDKSALSIEKSLVLGKKNIASLYMDGEKLYAASHDGSSAASKSLSCRGLIALLLWSGKLNVLLHLSVHKPCHQLRKGL